MGRLPTPSPPSLCRKKSPQIYGAQHPMRLVRGIGADRRPTAAAATATPAPTLVVVGHCCESGDILSPQPLQPELVGERAMGPCAVGDLLVIGGAGAYCSSMSAKHC